MRRWIHDKPKPTVGIDPDDLASLHAERDRLRERLSRAEELLTEARDEIPVHTEYGHDLSLRILRFLRENRCGKPVTSFDGVEEYDTGRTCDRTTEHDGACDVANRKEP